MRKLVLKLRKYLELKDFSEYPKFDKKHKPILLNLLYSVYSPMGNKSIKEVIFKNKKAFMIISAPIVLIILGVNIGFFYKDTVINDLQLSLDHKREVVKHFYHLSKEKQDSILKLNIQKDSLLSYFESRDWKEYVIKQESGITIPDYLPDSIFFIMDQQRNKYDIPHNIYWRLIYKESTFKGNLTSTAGANGYMQVMPTTFIEYKAKLNLLDTNDIINNIKVGSYYLYENYKMYSSMTNVDENRAWELALSAYNAGPYTVKKSGYTIPNIKETIDYVNFILQRES